MDVTVWLLALRPLVGDDAQLLAAMRMMMMMMTATTSTTAVAETGTTMK
jgi:hypothetical protein